jgi:hypothetical protein
MNGDTRSGVASCSLRSQWTTLASAKPVQALVSSWFSTGRDLRGASCAGGRLCTGAI